MKPNMKLKLARVERGLSQMDTGIKIGIGRDRYWHIENGYAQPTEGERAKLAKLLKVDVNAIFPAADEAGARA